MARVNRRISQRGKTLRAFGAYLDLLDTAERMRSELRGQLDGFGLTVRGFRLLEILYREGPMLTVAVAEKLECSRQNVDFLLERLEARGWVRRFRRPLRSDELEERRQARERRHRQAKGRSVGVLRLTAEGNKFIGTVFPKHAKVVKSLMRVLDGREQQTLSRLLQKLREGDIVKFVREIRMKRPGERGWESENATCS
ncbi:MAG: MarR family transcriptional regulator [Candidatus Acidiferrales bacterium]|jgi:MarR family 2-MHQ and catechol resistance regulon transcriptional repressor